MSRFRVLILLFVLAMAGALQNGHAIWWGIAGAILAFVLVAVAWAWSGVNWLRLARRTNTRTAQAGHVLEEEFKLTNLSRLPKLWVEIRDQSTLPAHFASRVLGLIGGSQWRGWRTRTRCALRGRYYLGPVEVRSGDPLGIYQMRRKIDIVHPLLVYPATFDLQTFPLKASHLPDGNTLRRRTHQVTANAAGVRDYVMGDSINRIHWPTSARRGRLIVKEFELDSVSDIWVALDLHQAAHVGRIDEALFQHGLQPVPDDETAPAALPASTEEYAVSIAASCARYFVRQEREVGLMMHGVHRYTINAERGERQLNKMLETLAVIRADGLLPFGSVLASETVSLPRGITVVAVSASLNTEWAAAIQGLTRGGLRVVAVFIDASSFPDAPPGAAEDSASVQAALANSGALLRVVRYGDAIAETLQG
jgi:uncharacterized protein (DUF58 family)